MKSFNIFALLLLVTVLCFPVDVSAVKAYPYPVEVKQPNGETITIQAHGDEFFHYATTIGGYIVAVDNDGYFTFAEINSEGNIQPGKVRVSENTLRSSNNSFLKANSPEFIQKIKQSASSKRIGMQNNTAGLRSPGMLRSTKATVAAEDTKALVILAEFTDKAFSIGSPNPDQTKLSFTNMLNQSGYKPDGAKPGSFTGSVRDYFIDSSDGVFSPQFEVYGPVKLPNNMAFYGANDENGYDIKPDQMIIDACFEAKKMYPSLNFADFPHNEKNVLDNVCVIYAGYNEAENYLTLPNTIWPHQYYLRATIKDESKRTIDGIILDSYMCTSELRGQPPAINMTGMGTFTHEYSHTLGMPDLYDANGEVDGQVITEPGYWSLMSSGNYLNNGNTPPAYSYIERLLMGWIEYYTASGTGSIDLTLPPITSSETFKAFAIETPTEDEFFTLEVRKKAGWDSSLPGEGMLIFHIDMSDYIVQTRDYGDVSIWNLWGGGIPNIVGDRPGMKLITANGEEMSFFPIDDENGYYDYINYQGHPFPGNQNVTSISDYTSPANFLSWNNEKSGVSVYNIVRNPADGSVSFTYSNTGSGIEENNINSPFAFSRDNAIYFKNISGSTQVNIYDVRGILYLSKNIHEQDNQEITIPGIYIVKLQTNNEVFTYKIIIR